MALEDDGRPEVVLVVEDEILVRSALAEYLRHCGFTVVEAATTDEAATVLAEDGLRVDVMLCAAEVRGSVNPFELARLARARRPELDVVLAGGVEKAAAAAGNLCDDGPRLGRPYDHALVVERIRRRLASRPSGEG